MLKANESTTDRIIRVVVGLVLIAAGILVITGVVGIIAAVVGAILVATGAVGMCPIYMVLGIRTNNPEADAS